MTGKKGFLESSVEEFVGLVNEGLNLAFDPDGDEKVNEAATEEPEVAPRGKEKSASKKRDTFVATETPRKATGKPKPADDGDDGDGGDGGDDGDDKPDPPKPPKDKAVKEE